MNIKIAFHNMTHSQPMEDHVRQKVGKISEFLKYETQLLPFNIEVWLKANAQHPHHQVELHVKTAHFNLHTHDEGTDIYVALDNTIDTMVELVKKEKERRRDARRMPNNEKAKFQK
jgi:ribosomal subunit interface protein